MKCTHDLKTLLHAADSLLSACQVLAKGLTVLTDPRLLTEPLLMQSAVQRLEQESVPEMHMLDIHPTRESAFRTERMLNILLERIETAASEVHDAGVNARETLLLLQKAEYWKEHRPEESKLRRMEYLCRTIREDQVGTDKLAQIDSSLADIAQATDTLTRYVLWLRLDEKAEAERMEDELIAEKNLSVYFESDDERHTWFLRFLMTEAKQKIAAAFDDIESALRREDNT